MELKTPGMGGLQRSAPALIATCLLLLQAHILAAQGKGPRAVRVDTLAELEGGTGGLTVSSDGTIFSSEFGNWLGNAPEGEAAGGTRVFRVTPQGEVSVLSNQFRGASGSGIDSAGAFFQSNIRGNTVSKVTRDGAVSTFASDGLLSPVGLEVDPEGTLWVANCGSGSIQQITAEGVSTQFTRSPLLKCPNGITRGPDGTLYVANFMDGNVVRVTAQGEASVLATLPGNNNGHLIYGHDALWVVARSAHQIFRLTLDGHFEVVAGSGEQGGKNGAPLAASFSLPNDLGWSPDGKVLYVNEVADEKSAGRKLFPTRVRSIVFE